MFQLKLISNVTKTFHTKNFINHLSVRNYAVRKRFYRKTGILYSDGKYEITLDQRKLKTPKGKLFTVTQEPLALAIAQEWDAQKTEIKQSTMHLTALCSTVLDNPNNLTKEDIVSYVVKFLESDTILCQSNDSDDLSQFQANEWDPIIEWFNKRYGTNIKKSTFIGGAQITSEDINTIKKHLLSYDFACLNGIMFAVDTLKSIILTLACIDRFITPERAVYLARLEEEFQLKHWQRVEWAHDLNQQELQARLSAAILFVHLNSTFTKIQSRHSNLNQNC